jgi:hypothetical protein
MSAATKVDRTDLTSCSVEGIGRMGHMARIVVLPWAISFGLREEVADRVLRGNLC